MPGKRSRCLFAGMKIEFAKAYFFLVAACFAATA